MCYVRYRHWEITYSNIFTPLIVKKIQLLLIDYKLSFEILSLYYLYLRSWF